ncbi:MAG: hypothetical protein A2W91_01040 [Bacteroidetes bacterium GWF2_38_335]|nr:MAG: hypothetical protein A2W91_01040 [Bacteroidetes bacterium GWF2_38_335]OFY80339.1 MAG: hypothetical protein A2281_17550 [Bacteroidetes bacterium RIFOXYA12_FULL_38_20]HBS88860.1 hypothetical protein [Bacteroidales bacterium]
MKKLLLILPVLAIILASCSSDDDSVTPSEATSTLTSDQWRISYYWDKDKDETSDYSGYVFTFNDDGSLTAVKGSVTVSGSWSVYSSDGYTKLDIDFGTAEPLSEFNDDWKILEQTSAEIKLEDQSGSGGTETLHFVKI